MLGKRMEQIDRLFYILTYLTNHEYATATVLAERCGTTARSIYRDMKKLEELGLQYTAEGQKGYRMIVRPIPFKGKLTKDEWLALTLYPLLNNGMPSGDHAFQRAYQSGVEKVLNVVSKPEEVSAIGAKLGDRIRLNSQTKNSNHCKVMPAILEAIQGDYSIHVEYHSMYRDAVTQRKLDPYYLLPRDGQLYLIAYCHNRDEIRTFRMDRFKKVGVTKERFMIAADFSISVYLGKLWSIIDEGDIIEFVVKFNEAATRYVEEYPFYADATIERLSDGSCILKTSVKSKNEFLRWVRPFGLDAEVLEPLDIRQELHREYQAMAMKYSK